MARLDEDQRFREARAEELRERDRHREPRSFRRLRRDLAGRSALRITLVERASAAQDERAADAAPAEVTAVAVETASPRSHDV